MTRLIFALAACSFVLLGAACGQSGPLYLPGNPSQIQNPPPAPAGAEEKKEEKEDKEEDGDAPPG